jgi:hypothetical protein
VQNRTEAAALAVRNGIVPPTQFPGFSDDEPAKSA